MEDGGDGEFHPVGGDGFEDGVGEFGGGVVDGFEEGVVGVLGDGVACLFCEVSVSTTSRFYSIFSGWGECLGWGLGDDG